MRNQKRVALLGMSGVAVASLLTGAFFVFNVQGSHAAPAGVGRASVLQNLGTTSFTPTAPGSGALQNPEFPAGGASDDGASATGGKAPVYVVNRSKSVGHGHGAGAPAGTQGKAKSNPELVTSFNGLDFHDQRTANGGNQFSVEPPDQGLCAGNGFVMESVNDVLNVYDTSGKSLLGVTDLNTFYHYPAQFNRKTGAEGPQVTDPSCYFDGDTQRWFQVALTYEVDANGNPTGANHLDIAVSNTASPLGTWHLYQIQAADDGTRGTPSHADCPCLGDYPHIGADHNGFYITTNEYSWFSNGYNGAQLYALSKTQAAAGSAVNFVHIENLVSADGRPGFTVWPAVSPAHQYANEQGGTEYFLSSLAAAEANGDYTASTIALWALSNTQSLNSASPALAFGNSILNVNTYTLPPAANQPATGDWPLGQCLNDTACSTAFNGEPDPYAPESVAALDSNDTRMQQVTYANGKLWSALDTGLSINGTTQAGIEYFIVQPHVDAHGVSGRVDKQGYVGMANNNLTYPAISVLPNGKGVMAFTLVGADYYPSAAYASIDDKIGVGDIHVAATGAGLQDGFSGYMYYNGGPARPRWGDYGAAVADGNNIWIASEYIGQTCSLATFESDPSCGGTRGVLGNWYTRISELHV